MNLLSKILLLVLAPALSILGGCSRFENFILEDIAKTDVPVAVYAGFEVSIDQKNTRIWGNQQCPDDAGFQAQKDCILIAPNARQIQVFFHQDEHPKSEIWTLQGDAPGAPWRRPDGTVVLSSLSIPSSPSSQP